MSTFGQAREYFVTSEIFQRYITYDRALYSITVLFLVMSHRFNAALSVHESVRAQKESTQSETSFSEFLE